MNFNDPIAMQYRTGIGCALPGLLGRILPWEWNILRLRRGLGKQVPDKIKRLIPGIIGTDLIVCRVTIIIATATSGKLN